MMEMKRTDPEPSLGSILVLESVTGTAVQRFYSDSQYHATTGKIYPTFGSLFDRKGEHGDRTVLLLFEAPSQD